MELVHMVRRIDSVILAECAEHLDGQLEVDHIDHIIVGDSELTPRKFHYKCVPFAVFYVAKHHRFKIVFEGAVR